MGRIALPGNPPIPVELRSSARARRISLRLSGVDGRVTLTLPESILKRVKPRHPMAFVAGTFPVHIRQCGSQSKHSGKFQITDGTGFGGAFYGYATPEGEWTPTRATPPEVIEAIRKR